MLDMLYAMHLMEKDCRSVIKYRQEMKVVREGGFVKSED